MTAPCSSDSSPSGKTAPVLALMSTTQNASPDYTPGTVRSSAHDPYLHDLGTTLVPVLSTHNKLNKNESKILNVFKQLLLNKLHGT